MYTFVGTPNRMHQPYRSNKCTKALFPHYYSVKQETDMEKNFKPHITSTTIITCIICVCLFHIPAGIVLYKVTLSNNNSIYNQRIKFNSHLLT